MNSSTEERLPEGMDFLEFIAWSQHILRTEPNVMPLCETRVALAFDRIRPVTAAPESPAIVHRYDLALRWCEVRGLSPLRAKTTLICEGVRHGLQIILRLLAEAGGRIAIPQDVYPVYWRIALEAGINTLSVETFPNFDLQAILDVATCSDAFIVLLPLPLKLSGRYWTEDEVAIAIKWLGAESRRRLILDGVYSFGLPVDVLTERLLDTGQVIYLDSLSKGWVYEQQFGAAIVPEHDLETYAESFRNLRPSQSKLFLAQEMLFRFRNFPSAVVREIDIRRDALQRLVDRIGLRTLPIAHGYLLPIEASASRLLEEHGVLAIPATAFGSKLTQWSIASALLITGRP
jgi:aspartate/methionine/tyrosine aminotransferase